MMKDSLLLYVLELLIDNQGRRADAEMMNVMMLVSVEGVGRGMMIIISVSLDLALFSQAQCYPAQPTTANMVTTTALTTAATTTHGLTQNSNSGVKTRVTTLCSWHVSIC